MLRRGLELQASRSSASAGIPSKQQRENDARENDLQSTVLFKVHFQFSSPTSLHTKRSLLSLMKKAGEMVPTFNSDQLNPALR